jgi:soluble lytic murein transglycosylase-like protein
MRGWAFILLGAAVTAAAGARAEPGTPQAYPDFTFRRVAAPPAGQGPKITVQIDPAEQAAYLEATRPNLPDPRVPIEERDAAPAAAALPAASGWEWFWANVAASIAGAGPANVTKALAALEGSAEAPAPRLQALQDIARRYGREILTATVGTEVSPALVVALISVESAGQEAAESGKGALGLMQLVPDTAARFGVTDPTDPEQNIRGGVAYLSWLLQHFDRDPILALAGYNAGENAVTEAGGVPPYAETRAYVPKVLNAWRVARGLCRTPPELITDGCVFAVQG